MNEKKLKELLKKLDVNSQEANIVRNILQQYLMIRQTKMAIQSAIQSFKVDDLYSKFCGEGENNG